MSNESRESLDAAIANCLLDALLGENAPPSTTPDTCGIPAPEEGDAVPEAYECEVIHRTWSYRGRD